MAKVSNIYHEKQRKQLCALHSLNNLLQDKNAFSQKDLESLCIRLSPNNRIINPHRSILGIGNYDINVIMAALQTKGLEAIWFDNRRDPGCLNLNNVYGFILNLEHHVSTKNLLSFFSYINPANIFITRKHWIAVKKINGFYYNLDSKLNFPIKIGQDEELVDFLKQKCDAGGCQILLVVSKEVADSHSCYY